MAIEMLVGVDVVDEGAYQPYRNDSSSITLSPIVWGVLSGLMVGRAVQLTPEKRHALFEPFDKSRDQLREFAHRRC